MTVYSIQEPWDPGIQPDPDEAAAVLIGRDNLQKLHLAGIRLISSYWDVTSAAVEAVGGQVVPMKAGRYWSDEDYAAMFGPSSQDALVRGEGCTVTATEGQGK
jgi:hypothetical protein